MNYFCDAVVGEIQIIAKKKEETDFVFHNPCRQQSGYVCFLSGEGSIEIKGVGRYPVEPGSFLRYEAGDCYFIKVSAPCVYYVSAVDISFNNTEVFPRATVCTESELSAMEKIYKTWSEQGEYCYMETRILLLRFLLDLSKRLRSDPSENASFLLLALSYIHRHFNENFLLTEIAAACQVSPSHLRNSFRTQYGLSVMQYREDLRITRAKTMLESGEYRISEIASLLGYCDVYHFSRKFKYATGLPPSLYAKK